MDELGLPIQTTEQKLDFEIKLNRELNKRFTETEKQLRNEIDMRDKEIFKLKRQIQKLGLKCDDPCNYY
jgi:hypothetical protein